MDGQTPPGYYSSGQGNNWVPEGPEHEDQGLHNLLTNSQTQFLIEELNLNMDGNSNFTGHVQGPGDIPFINHGPSNFPSYHSESALSSTLIPSINQAYVNHSSTLQDGTSNNQVIQNNMPFSCPNEVPALDTWPGQLNFHVEFSKAQDRTKATPWIFSSKLAKLFVSMDKACPISFKLDASPQGFSGYCLRGQVVYSKADDFKDVVERCLNHQGKDIPPLPNTSHVLRCDDTSSSYIDHHDKRHSVLVPLKQPAPGTRSITLCFRFMCLSSCIGSLNRRPTKLIFTLETVNGEVIGRYVCDVRICSCPGRDIRSEEGKEDKKFNDLTPTITDGTSNSIPIELPSVNFKGKTKKRKTHAFPYSIPEPLNQNLVADDDEIFILPARTIRGRRNFEEVTAMVERFLRFIGQENNQPPYQHNYDGKRFKEEQP